jgi:hypothetical protein
MDRSEWDWGVRTKRVSSGKLGINPKLVADQLGAWLSNQSRCVYDANLEQPPAGTNTLEQDCDFYSDPLSEHLPTHEQQS